MKEVKIKSLDAIGKKFIENILEHTCSFIESDEPDFVIGSPGTLEQSLAYDCVRIWITGENIRPDFNLVDYAIGFDAIQFGDRYLQLPLYAFGYHQERKKALIKHENIDRDWALKREFCSWIVSNGGWAAKQREEIYHAVSAYKKIDCGGKYLNNLPGGEVIPVGQSVPFYSRHKFTLALENSQMPGYTTEKIIEAWAGQTVPIYWGDPVIETVFNKDSFINATRYSSWDELLCEVRRIDQDDDAYMRMLETPILIPGSKCYEFMKEEYAKSFLENIFINQTPEQAKRRLNAGIGWGFWTEKDLKEYYQIRKHQLLYRIAKKLSQYMGKNNGK